MAKEQFINSIVENLKSNGFPKKKVSLPLEKMYEVADSKGLSFNDVLVELENQGISHSKTEEKIIFSPKTTSPLNDIDPNMFSGLNKDNIQDRAQEFMSQLSPEQLAEIQKMYMNMSSEEKENILKHAKNVGL